MAKFISDAVFDAALAKVATCTRMSVTSAQPANFAGIAAVSLGNVTLTAGDGNGDYTIANGDTSGRKVSILAQSITSASGSGTVTHVCLDDGTTLHLVSTVTSQAVTSGNPISVPAFDYEIPDQT